jgi:hypothetical protein
MVRSDHLHGRSEHGQVDLSASEHGAGGGEGVALDQEVLRQGVDVTEAALEGLSE